MSHSAQVGEYLVFVVGGERYALPLGAVLEIRRPPQVTPVPHVPAFVRGVTNLRGSVLAVLDLGAALGFEAADVDASGRRARLLVCHHEGIDAGFVVDCVDGVRRAEDLAQVLDGLPDDLRRNCLGTLRLDGALAAVVSPGVLVELRAGVA